MTWRKNIMTLVMLSIFLVMVGMSTQYPPQSRFMPLVVGIPGILLCLLQLFLDWRSAGRRSVGEPADDRNEFERAQERISSMTGKAMQFDMAQEHLKVVVSEASQEGERRREFILWGSLIALVASVLLLGFWITIPAFLLLFLRYFAQKNWRFSAALAAGGTGVLYLVFQKGLGVILHGGYLTMQILDLVH